jgi:geranylgeranyl diphosphate synthase type II
MIVLETAGLLGCSLELGAMVPGPSNASFEAIDAFGKAAGIGCQLQDDYLDAFGNPQTFGKQVGGDIISNKKTYLIIHALRKASVEDREQLEALYFGGGSPNPIEKVRKVKDIFSKLGVDKDIQLKSEEFFTEAKSQLNKTGLGEDGIEAMESFLHMLQQRKG